MIDEQMTTLQVPPHLVFAYPSAPFYAINATSGNGNQSRQAAEEQFLSNIFMAVGVVFILWLLFF